MKHVHVCLVSDQPIPNLTTVLQFKPESVVLLTTKDRKVQAERLEKVIKNKKINVSTREIRPYDINNVISVSEEIIDQCANCKVTLNITGGTKIGTLGTFQTFYSQGKSIFYVNTHNDEIIKVYPEEDSMPINVSLSIKEYLASYGFNTYRYLKNDSEVYKRKAVTDILARIAVKNPNAIGALNYNLPDDPEKESYPVEIALPDNSDVIKICQLLDSRAMAKHKGRSTIIIDNHTVARYLKGIWFEEHIYMLAKSLDVDEVQMNVEGEWDTRGKVQVKNEFDVVIAKKNRLFYITCKTSNPDRKKDSGDEPVSKDYLYELDALGDRAFGLFGKKLLASARPINNTYVKKRAQSMNIAIIDGKNIATMKENLKQWLNQ